MTKFFQEFRELIQQQVQVPQAAPIRVLGFKAASAPMFAPKTVSILVLASQASPIERLASKVASALMSALKAASIPVLAC